MRYPFLLGALVLHRTAAFHVWYDGGIAYGTLHYPGTTELCPMACGAGYGCAVDNSSSYHCIRCTPDQTSPAGSAECHSCNYADASSSGYWSTFVKLYLTPSADQSRCEVRDHTEFLVQVVAKNFGVLLGLVISAVVAYVVYWFAVAEHTLHRLVRKRQWSAAERLIDDAHAQGGTLKVCGVAESVAALVNRLGKDQRTPIQLALECGAASGYSVLAANTTGSTPQTQRSRIASLSQPLEERSSTPLLLVTSRDAGAGGSGDEFGRDTSSSPGYVREEDAWSSLVATMLNPQSVLAELDSRSASRQSLKMLRKKKKKKKNCFRCTIGRSVGLVFAVPLVMTTWWQWTFSGSEVGAVIDQGNFDQISRGPPKDLQECGYYCTVLGIAGGSGAVVFISPVVFIVGAASLTKWISAINALVRRTSDAKAASALVALVVSFAFVWLGAVFDGLVNFGGLMGAAVMMVVSVVSMVVFAPWLATRFIVRESDPFAASLKLLQQSKNLPVSTAWPLLRTAMLTTGPAVWETWLPPQTTKAKHVERAVEVAKALVSNARTLHDAAHVLHTLIEAHVAGIVDTAGCATVIAAVAALAPGARLLRALGKKNTPAETALISAKATSVKRAALIVLFDRFAVTSLEQCIYQSATCRVYRAEDLRTGAIVAVKLYRDVAHFGKECAMRDSLNFGANVEMADAVVADFQRYDDVEVRRDLARPSLAEWKRVLSATLFAEYGGGGIVMPLADYDLNSRLTLTRIAGIDAAECIAILRPMVAALAKLHSRGAVHNDVKPRNVVFVDETWKLIDLDAAAMVGTPIDAASEGFKWTSGFAAPELARICVANRVEDRGSLISDTSLDAFSLGVLMFELLTGQPLFVRPYVQIVYIMFPRRSADSSVFIYPSPPFSHTHTHTHTHHSCKTRVTT